jgi:hypothetical protein
MGADDSNEGHAAGECPEHVWQMAGIPLAGDGAHVEQTCTRCAAVVMVGPGELRGEH